ncbi:hypothetical protein [Amycolatopsis sp. DG1A-15b]|uniref:hypothetical protein n=1 Tax=Amycolatopsis sp. DG1A-15b TaxID=3052846 RepID=UPI00255C1309|nr:hypothetical protein [Amycolatopsis sp. DG1A-15b]WIX86351.1 hypothetical protein QRY02_34905 [Amycolatopsis sp. DG1A-15b]
MPLWSRNTSIPKTQVPLCHHHDVELIGSVAQGAPDPDGTPPAPADATAKPPPVELPTTTPGRRDELLGKEWQKSGDRLWTTSGDSTGFHLLVADAKTGYTWRTAATLSERGLEADEWIGNACVTASGKRAIVAYAPRTFTNRQQLFDRGAFTAQVDLDTGAITKLPVQTTLAYYNPGCGSGEKAALTQAGSEDLGKTRLLTFDTATGQLGKPTDLTGQLTSAVPLEDGYAVAGSTGLLRVAPDGSRKLLSRSAGVPFHVRVDAGNNVVFMDTDGETARIRQASPTPASATPDAAVLASGKLSKLDVAASATGKVFITGHPDQVGALPGTVARLEAPTSAVISTRGEAIVSDVAASGTPHPEAAQPVHIAAKSLRTGKDFGFAVDPGTTSPPPPTGTAKTPALAPNSTQSSPVDDGRYCAVPRNDPKTQVYQPTPWQVEWAADMAVKGHLSITRPANWNSNGLAAYVPQQLFPQVPLKGLQRERLSRCSSCWASWDRNRTSGRPPVTRCPVRPAAR